VISFLQVCNDGEHRGAALIIIDPDSFEESPKNIVLFVSILGKSMETGI
jgi:hypothetical protein